MDSGDYRDVESFVSAFAYELLNLNADEYEFPEEILSELKKIMNREVSYTRMKVLFRTLSKWCETTSKPVVLMIDEVDQAANNQIFLDFLSQIREQYLKRNINAAFQSVILAGVHDVRNLRQKIRADEEHRHNSPWNIAASFDVEMSFSADDISGMLNEYEHDKHTGMDISNITNLIYDYTSGYPVLVSTI